MGDDFRDLKEFKKRMKAKHGVDCPACKTARPKACPTRLLPKQRCKVDGHIDERDFLTDEQIKDI